MSQFYNPVKMYFGIKGVEQIAASMTDDNIKLNRVLLLTRGSEVEKSDPLNPLMAAIKDKDVLLKEISLSNPNLEDVLQLKKETDAFEFELIIAIGGGSVMDLAKALSAMQRCTTIETAEDVRTVIVENTYVKQPNMTPWIGIPTTSGTGSEVTSWATVWDEERGCKYSIVDERLYAESIVLLPELTVFMPLKLSATTALDAMCHATEAYWSVRTNPISRIYALQAIERIRVYLPQLKDDPTSLEIRQQLALASLYAGLAFSNTKTTACHSISYPLTLLHGIEHGIAASFTLGAVMSLNQFALVESKKLFSAFGAKNPEDVQQIIFQWFKQYGIPTQLREYGVSQNHIPNIVERSYTRGRMDNNPVEITEQQIHQVLTALI